GTIDPGGPQNLDIDFTATLSHNLCRIYDVRGERWHMDTSGFNKQDQAHLSFYHSFMNGSKIVIVLVILTLIIMAATLL
ncbi:MAG: hypothetical protein ACPHVY_01500, partial [Candidatus Puniceispirillaceae bacterium]